jgi:hypothetical protein
MPMTSASSKTMFGAVKARMVPPWTYAAGVSRMVPLHVREAW